MDKACETMNELSFEIQAKINEGLPGLGSLVEKALKEMAGQQVPFAILVFPGTATQGTSNLCEHHLIDQLIHAIRAMSAGSYTTAIVEEFQPAGSSDPSLH